MEFSRCMSAGLCSGASDDPACPLRARYGSQRAAVTDNDGQPGMLLSW